MARTEARKPTNLSLDQGLLADARAFRINLSRAAEDGIRAALAKSRAQQWKAENAEAIASSNAFTKENGLPLARQRQF